MKAREVMTTRMRAVSSAESTSAMPAVWLRKAAGRAAENSAKAESTTPLELGSSRPTASPGAASAAKRTPSTLTPIRSCR
jgi:hypothetical protein